MEPSLEEIERKGTALGRALHRSARVHKRSELAHKREARALQKELADLRELLGQFGIELVVDEDRTGGQGHDGNTHRSAR